VNAQKLGPSVVLLLAALACDMEGICTIDDDKSCQSNADLICYSGKKPKTGAKGVCVYGEFSPAGKPVAKIKAWKLVLPNGKEVAPLKKSEESPENADAGWVGMAEARVEVEVVGASPNEDLSVWTSHGLHAQCRPPAERKLAGEVWTCTLPEGWAASSKADTLQVHAQAREAKLKTHTYRVLCSHPPPEGLVGEPVKPPLAISGKRLLFGSSTGNTPKTPATNMENMPAANNSLHVFDTDACALVGSLHTGTLQGPMVVLGDTGRVAVALGNHGPPGREGQRLSLVEVSGATPNFVDSGRDCEGDGFFDKGLSLMSVANASTGAPWRLVAPANHSVCNKSRVAVYTPEAKPHTCDFHSLTTHCFQTPISQDDNTAVLGIYAGSMGAVLQGWIFEETAWKPGPPESLDIGIENVSPVAVFGGNFWVRNLSFESPVAVDDKGWGYFAVKPSGSDRYHLQLESPLPGSRNKGRVEANSPPFEGGPVGSPLLGEGGRVYVVTTTGSVLAYGTELGEPLWTYNLGIGVVESTAQPVLSDNTLWVVGARGEVRGIRVNSNGLSRKAHWPKTFRDNCNTSSRLSNENTLPSCF